ncbi:type IV secretion system DNA-binding domain-containing protein [Paludibacterium yongneupense]|uniref:type IV secretion system DNA-binding domain-containing protein n=1 Tax=Paludibacterium yongneupense TaxID=400061 RepID=UPI000A06C436|nr:type IV secretion system DNA-binding domain-containing protein [Paludibacterium yongneupense]
MKLFDRLFGSRVATQQPIMLGGVDVPRDVEPLHWLLAGSTGSGKTTLLSELLSSVIPRGDRVIVIDPAGHHMSRFGRGGDSVLNPFDRRGQCWSIFNEVRHDYDYDRLARSIIPDGEGADAQWHFYAQTLLAETMRALMIRGENNTESLMRRVTVTSSAELGQLLAGSAVAGLFDHDSARALASTRFILTAYLNPHRYLKPGAFSLRDWLHEGTGNLFINWREDMQPTLMPLISSWADILANAVLSLPPDSERRIWLVLDELGALERLGSLEGALTRGRKHGLCVVAGLQSTAQLDRRYGNAGATVLRSCFRNLIVLGLSKSDPDTAEVLSRALGEREVQRQKHSTNEGPQGISRGVTVEKSTERIALPSELTSLPNLTAYLALAGDHPTRLINIGPRDMPVVMAAMEE